jgi:hypothetical protein
MWTDLFWYGDYWFSGYWFRNESASGGGGSEATGSSIYVDNWLGGSQVIYGVTEPFKINWGVVGRRRRRVSNVIHLARAKPRMSTLLSPFTAAMNGTRVDVGEFLFIDPSKLLTITNIEAASGMALHPSNSYEIPISRIDREAVVLTNIYQTPESL